MKLSFWQRAKRRISLMWGSYTYPDGTIELDFEAAAGINLTDSDTVKEAKLRRYYATGKTHKKAVGPLLVGSGMFILADRLGLSFEDSLAVAALVALGLNQMARD